MSSLFSPSPYPTDPGITASIPADASIGTESFDRPRNHTEIDLGLVFGLAVAAAAMMAGIASTGISLGYFFQPAAAFIVLGGTFGVTLISTPRIALVQAMRRVGGMVRTPPSKPPESVIEEIVAYSRIARNAGLLSLEPALVEMANPFLRQVLSLALDVKNRQEFRIALDSMLRARERHGEHAVKALETAGGFAPTIGVLGTVVGLIDALRHFSDLSSVASGVGTAFVSTMYGLALANLLLLPAAHRIRACLESEAQADELIAEGGLGIYESIHPTMLRDRLQGFLRPADVF